MKLLPLFENLEWMKTNLDKVNSIYKKKFAGKEFLSVITKRYYNNSHDTVKYQIKDLSFTVNKTGGLRIHVVAEILEINLDSHYTGMNFCNPMLLLRRNYLTKKEYNKLVNGVEEKCRQMINNFSQTYLSYTPHSRINISPISEGIYNI